MRRDDSRKFTAIIPGARVKLTLSPQRLLSCGEENATAEDARDAEEGSMSSKYHIASQFLSLLANAEFEEPKTICLSHQTPRQPLNSLTILPLRPLRPLRLHLLTTSYAERINWFLESF